MNKRTVQSLNLYNYSLKFQVRSGGKGTFDVDALNIRSGRRENGTASPIFGSALAQQNEHQISNTSSNRNHQQHFGRFDASALHIAHALRATEVQKAYKKEKPMHLYLVRS